MTDSSPVGMILAAGLGTRMRPLTEALPKPLLPFLNTPIIAYTLDHLLRAGARRIAINTHHLGEMIPPLIDALLPALRPRFGDIEVTFVKEDDVRGTAGGIAGMWAALGRPEQTAIAINGDALMSLDLADALDAHRRSGALASIVTRAPMPGHPGRVYVGPDQRVCGLRDQGDLSGQEREFMGVHILEPEALGVIEGASTRATLTGVVADVYIPALGTALAPHALLDDHFWVALDNPGLLLDATEAVLNDPALFPQAPLPSTHGAGLSLMAPGNIHDKALLAAPVFAGALASIGAGARVGPFVTVDGTTIGAGARVERAVLFGMGHIEGTWERCVAVNGKIAQV